MKYKRFFLIYFSVFFLMLDLAAQFPEDRITTNPLNLSYQFYTDGVSHRTSADPVIEYFNGKYYLFGSHNEGYFSSPDLKTWTYIHSSNLPLVNEWAPAVLVYEGAIYYMAFNNPVIYKSTNPDADEWENINAKYDLPIGDPSFFKDDDGRVYLIAGCSAGSPIQGVELEPEDGFKVIGDLVDLLPHNVAMHGWEVPGDNNERRDKATWNEGPCLIKSEGLYYLQYATPGTEFTSYSTGVYVSENPLGPYKCSVSNPFATKLAGFIPGAGHGHTFQDKYGNYWFVGSMIVSVREHYERRLGIFPVYFDSTDGYMRARTVFSEFPFILPDKKVDFKNENISAGMNLLSYNKLVTASSSKEGFEPEKATDESIKTWWSAVTDNAGEWFRIDLGSSMTIKAIQMNFADEAFTIHRGDAVPIYQYIVETSTNGNDWVTTIDRSQNTNDYVHELIVLDEPVDARFVRVTNKSKLGDGCFSLYDLRIFGNAPGDVPGKVTGFACKRQSDSRRVSFTWDQQEANTRYVIYWGTDSNRIDNAAMVAGGSADIGLFHAGHEYYFSIEAFNESGIGPKSDTVYIAGSNSCGTAINPYLRVNNGSWENINYAIVNEGGRVEFGPQANSENGWEWVGPDGFTASTRSFTISNFSAAKAGFYTATFTNIAGSKSTLKFALGLDGCVSTSIDPTITVNDSPWIQSDSIILGSGDNTTIKIPVDVSDGLLTWRGPFGFSSGSSEITLKNLMNWEEGKYEVTYINSEACGSTHSIELVVSGDDTCGTAIIPYLQVNGSSWEQVNSATLNAGGDIKFGPQASNNNSWKWTGPNNFTSNDREITINNITMDQAGIYSLQHSNIHGCLSFSIFDITVNPVVNGIAFIGESLNISAYPCPVTDILTITNLTASTPVSVINVNGQTLLNTTSGYSAGDFKIDISALKTGVYFINVGTNLSKAFKIFKQ
ncbi:MAG: family 43 glycosylhydrolase [Salinivirgaceae bacterium]|jgi:xylan 1,4-beta-xylosidase|nr:family 43 glycosylhydrolase [Salinivirgaceae bacterium]